MSRFFYDLLPDKTFPLDAVAVRFRELCEARDDRAPNDASDFILVVQTAEAKRLLGERIVREFARLGGIYGLNILTPSALFRPPKPEPANGMEVASAWLRVFDEVDFSDFPDLLPGDGDRFRSNVRWRIGLADALQNLRMELAAEACPVREVSARLDEAARSKGGEEMWNKAAQWEQLARLEERYLRLFSPERPDPVAFQLEAVRNPWLPQGVRTVVFAVCPNPLPAAMAAAKNLPDDVRIRILLSGPEDPEAFDAWGRPSPDFWKRRILPFPDSAFHKFLKPEDQARKILALQPERDELRPSAVGVLDPEILDAVDAEQRLSGRNDFYLPRRIALRELPMTRMFLALADFLTESPSFDAAAALFRDPAVFAVLSDGGNDGDDGIPALLDELQTSAVLESCAGLRREAVRRLKNPALRESDRAALLRLDAMLTKLDAWRAARGKDGLLEALVRVFSEIAAGIPASRYGKYDEEALSVFQTIVRDARALRDVPDDVRIQLIRRELDRTALPDRVTPGTKTDLCGFLELPWRTDVPLLIAGCNEEMFENGAQDDAFLPDRVRSLLGFRDRAFHFAVDVFQTDLLLRSRPPGGVVVLFGAVSSGGDPLKPARILFQTRDEELPARAELLFGNACFEEPPLPAKDDSAPKRYVVRKASPRKEAVMSITGFKTYLNNPFRYYFERVLDAKILEDRNAELDDADYGTLVHDALKILCGENAPAAPDSDAVDRAVERVFQRIEKTGNSGIPRIQKELIRGSLRSFARIQAEERANGWSVATVETPFDFPWNDLFSKYFPSESRAKWRDAVRIRGRIDRIDRHPTLGWRILDYKTSKNATAPVKAHWAKRRKLDPQDEWKTVGEETSTVWTDLQLPLYLAAFEAGLVRDAKPSRGERTQAGYFNLPLAFSETGIEIFQELSGDAPCLGSAIRTADEVLQRAFLFPEFDPAGRPDPFDDLYQMIGDYSEPGVLALPRFEPGELHAL